MEYILSCICPNRKDKRLIVFDQTNESINYYRGEKTKASEISLVRNVHSIKLPLNNTTYTQICNTINSDGKARLGLIEDIELEFRTYDLTEADHKRMINLLSASRVTIYIGGSEFITLRLSEIMSISYLLSRSDIGYKFSHDGSSVKFSLNLPFFINNIAQSALRYHEVNCVFISGHIKELEKYIPNAQYNVYLHPCRDLYDSFDSLNNIGDADIKKHLYGMIQKVTVSQQNESQYFNHLTVGPYDTVEVKLRNLSALLVLIDYDLDSSEEERKEFDLPHIISVETDNHLALVNADMSKQRMGDKGQIVYIYSCDPDYEDKGLNEWINNHINSNQDSVDIIRSDDLKLHNKTEHDNLYSELSYSNIKIKLSRSYAQFNVSIVPIMNAVVQYNGGMVSLYNPYKQTDDYPYRQIKADEYSFV